MVQIDSTTKDICMRLVFVLFLFLALFAQQAVDAGIIANGDFEQGDLSAWTLAVTGGSGRVDGVFKHSGEFGFRGANNDGFATLSQTLTTMPGTSYDLSFFTAANSTAGGNIFRYQIGTGAIDSVVTTLAYTETSSSFVAATSGTELTFFYETDPGTGNWLLDDVSVAASSVQPSQVPEPTSILAFAGLATCFVNLRRRRRTG